MSADRNEDRMTDKSADMQTDKKYRYWLTHIAGIGNIKIGRLMQCAGDAETIYRMREEELEKIYGITQKDVHEIVKSRLEWDIDGAYEKFLKSGIAMVTLEEEAYPRRLKVISYSPYALFYKGMLPKEDVKTIAIVGARSCSEYGRHYAIELGQMAAKAGVSVISGMAMGIDGAGHYGAMLGGGTTYAVLGCGVDYCYPSCNRRLYDYMAEHGGLIAEYVPGTQPVGKLFPQRNRIISALSDIVVIVEAKERSGSLITADFALEQGKDIYALPGRISDALSAGCNRLIRQGAGMILSVEDFFADMEISCFSRDTIAGFSQKVLEKEERLVYSVVDLLPKHIEEILSDTQLDIVRLFGILAKLERLGVVREVHKNYYIRIR